MSASIDRATAMRFLSTTANALDGYRVMQTYGVVRGIVVRSRGAVGLFGAKLQMLFGGDITLFTELCERARADAYDHAISHAQSLGANAMIALRYDATEVMPGVSEVLCYGTAVRVVPVKETEAGLPRA
jgi:uncharacterized protein YbjQ (UPF0145 family)